MVTREERGSASLYLLWAVLAVAGLGLVLLGLGGVLVGTARARSAADLAALAAASRLWAGPDGACAAARRVAAGQQAGLRACRPGGDASVTVTVEVALPGWLGPIGPATARARAGPAEVRAGPVAPGAARRARTALNRVGHAPDTGDVPWTCRPARTASGTLCRLARWALRPAVPTESRRSDGTDLHPSAGARSAAAGAPPAR